MAFERKLACLALTVSSKSQIAIVENHNTGADSKFILLPILQNWWRLPNAWLVA
jgi:hypothetical protein